MGMRILPSDHPAVQLLHFDIGRGFMRSAAMEIKRGGSQPSAQGPAEYFTGAVRIDPLFKAPEPVRASGASVTFEPCAHSAWHTHPLGQTLLVTSGCGLVQSWGGPIRVILAVTSCGTRRVRSTGTARPRTLP
jgi:hypothetical protein